MNLRTLLAPAILFIGVGCVGGCVTNPNTGEREFDFARTGAALELAAGELEIFALLTDDEDLAADLNLLSVAARDLKSIIDGVDGGDLGVSIDNLLDLTLPILEKYTDKDSEIRLVVAALRSAVLLIEFAVGADLPK